MGEDQAARIAELEARVVALEEERSDLLDRLSVIRTTATPPAS